MITFERKRKEMEKKEKEREREREKGRGEKEKEKEKKRQKERFHKKRFFLHNSVKVYSRKSLQNLVYSPAINKLSEKLSFESKMLWSDNLYVLSVLSVLS